MIFFKNEQNELSCGCNKVVSDILAKYIDVEFLLI